MRLWLLEIEALDQNDDPVTLRYSTHFKSTPNPYEVRLLEAPIFQVSASSGLIGQSQSGYGEAVLANMDGGLDYLADYAVDGRTCRLTLVSTDEQFESGEIDLLAVDSNGDLLNVDSSGSHLIVGANSVTAFLGTVHSLAWQENTVLVRLRDGREALERPHPYNTYAGDNVLPAGVEGTEDDIVGLMKPKVYGAAANVKPVLVNSSQYIIQIHDGSSFLIGAVYDQGVLLTEAASQPEANAAALEASTPASGEYTWYAGLAKLGAVPSEATMSGGRTDANQAGEVFELIAGEAGYSVESSDITALDALGVARIYMDREMTTASMLDRIARSFGCWWTVLPSGTIRVRQLDEPSSSPSITIEHHQIVSIARPQIASGATGLPVWRVTLACDQIEYVQNVFAASAPGARQARFSNKYRHAIASDSATQTRHPLADELYIESDIRNLTEAQAVADHLLDLFKVRRDFVRVDCYLASNVLAALTIGTSVKLVTTKFGYSAGRNFLVLGFRIDGRRERATLELWG